MLTWTIGIDPGLRETGLCLLDSDLKAVEAKTIKAAEASEASDLERIFRLAKGVSLQICHWRVHIPAEADLLISIEYPIMNARNVTNYRKQINTLHAIEHELVYQGIGQYLIEVNPTESKLAGTGDGGATKAEIIAASPFTGSGHTIETMADAWMHGVCGARKAARSWKTVVDLGNMETYPYHFHAREDGFDA